ncbi:MAG: RagB/SusD family nutrient uptake outer membrane protein [Bacteroidia bacterium]|nr:RagB/SusD family nutrient uptake outer membrane protein [Bacteroidia bacterium]
MIRFNKYMLIGMIGLATASCSDFLNTMPYDALSPSTTWKTEEDAQKFAVGCYDGWEDGGNILYMDCTSDFAYNNFSWEGYKSIGNGSFTASSGDHHAYDFTTIRRCNTFLEKIKEVPFADEKVKTDLIAQIRVIRAYQYFTMNWWYGGVPIIENYMSSEEAKVPRNTEAEVRTFIERELDECVPLLNKEPAAKGRLARGAALAIRMREALYYGDNSTAKAKAQAIMDLGLYGLEPTYANLFRLSGKNSKEIIAAVQYMPVNRTLGVIGQMYNNGDGGWSSIVPTQNLVDTYEMKNGLTKEESGSGYDPVHPFAGRDPRMAMSVYYPGCNFTKDDGTVVAFNTLDKVLADGKANANYALAADNSSKTGLTWAKYLDPMTQYNTTGIWDTDACPIVFRYAEVLLTYAEAENELNGPSATVYKAINDVRQRSDMPKVDETKYNTKETLRELIRRERGVEFAGEGLRRADIVRWKGSDGKMVAEKVLTGVLERVVGTVNVDMSVDPELRATINPNADAKDKKIEDRMFKTHNRYWPIPQGAKDSNPKLTQNEGY